MELRSFRIITYLVLAVLLVVKPTTWTRFDFRHMFDATETASSISVQSSQKPIIGNTNNDMIADEKGHEAIQLSPTYRILSEAIIDDVNTVQGIIRILVLGDTSVSAVKKILTTHYQDFIKTRDYNSATFSSHIEIYAYDSLDKAGHLWIAMLKKNHTMTEPVIRINKTHVLST